MPQSCLPPAHCLRCAPAMMALWFLLAVAASTCGQNLAAPTKTAQEIWADIGVFEYLHGLGLNRQQAAALVAACRPLQDMRSRYEAQQNDPRVLAVLLEYRARVLAGTPVGDDLWDRLAAAEEAARGGPEGAGNAVSGDTLIGLAHEIATAAVAGMSAQQLAAAVNREARNQALSLLEEVESLADQTPEAWADWVGEAVGNIVSDGLLPEDADVKLTAFLDRVHAMPADEVRRQREALAAELAGLMSPQRTEAELREAVASELAEHLLHTPGFIPCLEEYAQAAPAG